MWYIFYCFFLFFAAAIVISFVIATAFVAALFVVTCAIVIFLFQLITGKTKLDKSEQPTEEKPQAFYSNRR